MNCPNCGAENPEEDSYCGHCGTALSDESGPGWLKPGSASYGLMTLDWKLRWGVLAFVGIFMGVLFGAMAIMNGSGELCGFSILFLILGIVGAVVTWLNFRK